MPQHQPTHDDYIEQFGQTLEALIMIFSASVLMKLKDAVAAKQIAEADAEVLYEAIGEQLSDAMAQVDARLAARIENEHQHAVPGQNGHPHTVGLITMHHPEDHDPHQ